MPKKTPPPDNTVSFDASLPDIMSAISLPGDPYSGARIKLDVPASDVAEVLKLKIIGAGKPLRVTIEVQPQAASTALRQRLDRLSALEDDEDALLEEN